MCNMRMLCVRACVHSHCFMEMVMELILRLLKWLKYPMKGCCSSSNATINMCITKSFNTIWINSMCNGWEKNTSPIIAWVRTNVFFSSIKHFYVGSLLSWNLLNISIPIFDRMTWIYLKMLLITIKSIQTHNIRFSNTKPILHVLPKWSLCAKLMIQNREKFDLSSVFNTFVCIVMIQIIHEKVSIRIN